ncbi:MAG TPA: hypothetical protein VGO80_04995 [Solirubrobacteraceae bacterium]|jgi:hypothetical protein|nr:hypothetical protein [Solirubrobacteraceae bacterium]
MRTLRPRSSLRAFSTTIMHAERVRQRVDQREVVGDGHDAVEADLRPGELGARVGDELGGRGRRLAQLQPALHRVEVRVALVQPPLILGTGRERGPQRRRRVGADALDLEVAPSARHETRLAAAAAAAAAASRACRLRARR